MGKPILLTVDDDPEVLRAIERDLRRNFSNRFKIVRADSGPSALEALKQLKLRNEAVALFLADQRMPMMTGIEFLEATKELYPKAKRVLLTAYAETSAAIQAINQVKLDYYLTKPWDPPEEHLYPALSDLLDEWMATYQPPFQGVRLIGNRWSPATHQLKDFLARNQVLYQWLDAEKNPEAAQVLSSAPNPEAKLPIIVFPNGLMLSAPSAEQVAEKIGLRVHAEMPFYDLVIIGGGPAGLAAGVYGASEGLRTMIIEKHAPGGQAGTSSRIENYLGFPVGLSGADLARRAVAQAKRFGVEILSPQEAISVRANDPYRIITLSDKSEIHCYTVLIATGVSYRTLDAAGSDRLAGAGIYYGAAMTEALACKDEEVFIVGGANSAGQAAMHFSKYARLVTMIIRAESLVSSMSHYLIEQINQTPNIIVRCNATIAAVSGEERLESITIADRKTGATETLPAASLFIFIGAAPHTEWLAGAVERDEWGFILAGPDLTRRGVRLSGFNREPFLFETSMPGVLVAGDARANSVKRVASAVGQGSIAVQFVHQYLSLIR